MARVDHMPFHWRGAALPPLPQLLQLLLLADVNSPAQMTMAVARGCVCGMCCCRAAAESAAGWKSQGWHSIGQLLIPLGVPQHAGRCVCLDQGCWLLREAPSTAADGAALLQHTHTRVCCSCSKAQQRGPVAKTDVLKKPRQWLSCCCCCSSHQVGLDQGLPQ